MKIEVGKKYLDSKGQIIEIINNIPNYEYYNAGMPDAFIGINRYGTIRAYSEEGILVGACQRDDLIKEYHEPIKRSVEGWIAYHPARIRDDYFPLDILIGAEADPQFHLEKIEPTVIFPNVVYGELSFKQLPEPNE